MSQPSASSVRISLFVLLLLINVAPALIAGLDPLGPAASLAFCLGNGVWIMYAGRARSAERAALGSVWVPCLVMTVGALAWAWRSQPAVTLNGGLGWDGLHYAAMYSYFKSGVYDPVVPVFPYSQRVALPWLAAQLPVPAVQSFLLLHAIFWSTTMVLFAICCRACFKVSAMGVHFAVLWLQILWISIPRGTSAYAFTIDSAALFFMQAWILLLSPRWRWLLPVCAFTGVLFKETILLLVLLSVLALLVLWSVPRLRRCVPADLSHLRRPACLALLAAVIAAGIGKWFAAGLLPHVRAESEWSTLWHWIQIRAEDPTQVLRYVAAAFAAYGGFALLLPATLGGPAKRPRPWTFTFAAALGPLYLAICFIAGSDLTKFAFMGFPFVLPVLLTRFDDVVPAFAVLSLVLGLPAAHAFSQIPDIVPGHEIPHQDLEGVYSWMMEYAHITIVGSWMAWWMASVLALRAVAFADVWRPELNGRPTAERTAVPGAEAGATVPSDTERSPNPDR
jgi:hypothetical protein